ncbi:hypothetical protein J5N97_008072 [Dioscorea zingiberensis]|uniref:Uncharacterized protein n=1 Tax=Dioscorea zingiberensis TaxID=325984 RepID=A0A9D5HVJ4_9LILI|nr:hypothetical protein J5N97_008072 [Dioscorea zingiberensis]
MAGDKTSIAVDQRERFPTSLFFQPSPSCLNRISEAMNEETNRKKLDVESQTENNPILRISVLEAMRSGPSLVKQTSQKMSCLCSPTKHVGSFRCRLHRSTSNFASRSYGSGLSELVDKATSVSESNEA